MTVYKRICLKEHKVTDQEGASFTVQRGKEYTVSAIHDDGTRTVFSQYWVRVPADIFEPEGETPPAPVTDGRSLEQIADSIDAEFRAAISAVRGDSSTPVGNFRGVILSALQEARGPRLSAGPLKDKSE